MKFLPPLQSQDSMLAAMCYPAGIVVSPYILITEKKEDPFVMFHAIQGLVLNAAYAILLSLGFLMMFFYAKLSPPATKILSNSAGGWGNSYMSSGCFFIAMISGGFLIMLLLFIVLMICSGKVWNGEDIRIPFLGKMIERKYFADYLDEDELADAAPSTPFAKPSASPLNLPDTRHDIRFRK